MLVSDILSLQITPNNAGRAGHARRRHYPRHRSLMPHLRGPQSSRLPLPALETQIHKISWTLACKLYWTLIPQLSNNNNRVT